MMDVRLARATIPSSLGRIVPGPGLNHVELAGLAALAVVLVVATGRGPARQSRRQRHNQLGRHKPRRNRNRPKRGPGKWAWVAPRGRARGWAQSRDLRPLRVQQATGDRIVLGNHAGRMLAAEARHSVMVVGPTQSGKTTGIAIPAILEWRGPLLAMSVKADLLRETVEWRGSVGEVQYYDPTGSLLSVGAGCRPAGWSPLVGATSWQGARRAASALCSVARSGDGGMEDAGFWYANAEKLLAPLLFAAATAGASMADVVRWLDEEETAEVLLSLELAGVPEAIRAARASLGREERQRASVYATAETVVAAFADPAVAASAERCDVDPAALVGGTSGSLFCCAPARDQERLAPVFTAIVREVLDAAFERASATGRPLDPPLLVVLDEAASVAPLADLDRVVATAAGHGVQLVTVWQDLAQVESRYGNRWATVVNNHRAKLVCSGIADPLTLQHMSGLLGDGEKDERSWTIGEDGRRSRTEAVTVQPLAPPGWLRQLPPGEAVLVYGSFPPARIELRAWYADRGLAARVPIRRGDTGYASAAPGPNEPRSSKVGLSRLGTRRARLTAWSPRRS